MFKNFDRSLKQRAVEVSVGAAGRTRTDTEDESTGF